MTLRLCMWSGPRNISTAMMRAWENRPDCAVIDEPLYGYYLHRTGLDHPGAKEVILDQGTDWQTAVKRCMQPPAGGETIFFQKQMIMHLLPEVSLDWLPECQHMFLLRRPADVINSYSAVRGSATLEDLGYPQMLRLFNTVTNMLGSRPAVIDADNFLREPEHQLKQLCQRVEIEFLPSMLSWPAGTRSSDGVWAPHWYNSVEASTGFAPYQARQPQLSSAQQRVVDKAQPLYESMAQWALH